MSTVHRVDLEPAYILHSRAYRETSQILEVFTVSHGRLALIAKGARRPKSPLRGLLNPFQALRLSWSGRGEMQTLREAETVGPVDEVRSSVVMSCFYINELILKLLERADPHPDLFAHYSSLIAALKTGDDIEPLLRVFELQLLGEIGYEPVLLHEAASHDPVEDEHLYEFIPDYGVQRFVSGRQDHAVFMGKTLRAVSRHDLSDADVLREAKQLLRLILNHHLGNRALQTRRVASAMKSTG
ncbi:MAG: DNA repair protein RecO [Gammaproteobacteria bacterium]